MERVATHQSSSVDDVLARVPLIAGVIAIGLACLVLLGWGVGLSSLVRILPGWPPIMPQTAVSLILIGVALCILRLQPTGGLLRLAQGCALVAAAIAIVNLGEYLFGWSPGIDHWLFRLEAGDFSRRMAAPTAVAILSTAAALLLLDVRTGHGRRPTYYLASIAAIITMLEVIGQCYGAVSPYLFGHEGMALNTAVAIVSISVGIVCARQNLGLAVVMSDSAAGFMARRLLPAALVVPSLLGLLVVLGHRAGYYDAAYGFSLLVATNILVFLAVIWRNTESLHGADLKRQSAEKSLRLAYDEMEKRVEERTAELGLANEDLRHEVAERRRAEVELRRSQENLSDFFDNAPVGLHWVGPDGRILQANQAELDLLGYTREEYVGHPLSEFHVDEEAIADILDRLARGETLRSYEARLRTKDGLTRYVQLDSNVLWDEEQFVHTRCFTRDITERKQAEEKTAALLVSEQAARAQAEEAAELVRRLQVIIDISLMHLSLDELLDEILARIGEMLASDAAAILLLTEDQRNLTVCACVGLDTEVASELCIPGGMAARIASNRAPMVTDDLSASETAGPLLQQRVCSLIGAPLVVEGDVIGVIQVMTTIEPRRFTENDLRLLQLIADRVGLAIERARLYDAEQRARLQAETTSRMKDEFLATVSHELRSPLNAILGWVKILRDGKLGAEATARALETVERSARTQNRIINDLLDVSRIIAGKLRLNMRPLDPTRMVEAAVEAVRPAADAKAIRLEMSLDRQAGPISGDPERVQQLVWNLVSNAIKFTPTGGVVQVNLAPAGSYTEITVNDTGVGISPAFLPHVFDRFRQADGSSTRKQGGLGLGLALVKYLAELHGGTVGVDSLGEGKGATFTVRLPRVAIGAAKGKPGMRSWQEGEESEPTRLDGLRVLVVDDDADARDLVTTVLTQSNAEIKTAASVDEALGILAGCEEWQPEVLISDVEMPGADGYALIHRVRALEAEQGGGRLPAVALTAYARVEDRTRALAAGFQRYISKPLEPAELLAVVASLTGRVREGSESSSAQNTE